MANSNMTTLPFVSRSLTAPRRPSPGPLVSAATLLCLACACNPVDLGQCDEESAQEVYFDLSGFPAYGGQALTQTTCGNGSVCHSQSANSELRVGAPGDLDFDMVGSRTSDDTVPDTDDIASLRRGRTKVFDHRFAIFEEVENGTMPPGRAGEEAVAELSYLNTDGDPLPALASKKGRDMLKNWLSCGAPVVERTSDSGPGRPEGAMCPGGEVGDCYVRSSAQVVNPTWQDIYTKVFVPQCVDCHSSGGVDFVEESQLDLGSAAVAYAALVGMASAGQDCASSGTTRVVAGNPDDSLLIHKVDGSTTAGDPVCGDPMPTGTALSSQHIAAIRQWIQDGALNN